MATAYRSHTSGLYYGSTDLVVTAPSGVASGDVLLFVANTNDYTRTLDTLPSGWTSLYNQETSAGTNAEIWVAWKLAGGSEPGSYTFVFSDLFNGTACIAAFSGSDGEIHASEIAAVSAIQTGPYESIAPATTATASAGLAVAISAGRFSTSGAQPTLTAPSGYTKRVEEGADYDVFFLGICDKTFSTSGSQASATSSWAVSGGGNGRTHAVHVLLADPVTGPTLSLAGVQGITATGATPNVTLTF